jgi:hypothetical protein
MIARALIAPLHASAGQLVEALGWAARSNDWYLCSDGTLIPGVGMAKPIQTVNFFVQAIQDHLAVV